MDVEPPHFEPPHLEPVAFDPPGRRRVLSSAALLGTATIAAKVAALAKDWLVARQLGAGDELDAFLVAFLIPSYAVAVLAHSLALAFVPAYVRVWHERGLPAAQRLAGGVLSYGMLVLGAVTLLAVIGVGYLMPVLGWGFAPEKIDLACRLFYFLAGVILASGLSVLFGAVLNAHERFVPPALASIVIPLATLAVFGLWQGQLGVYALAIGTLAGFVIEAALLGLVVWRLGWLPRPQFDAGDDQLWRVGHQYLAAAGGGALMSSSLVVDQSMAASLGSGQVSILNYGGKVVTVVVAAVAVSISTVLFPTFSRLIAGQRHEELWRTVVWYARLILLASIPGVVLLAIGSEPLIRLLFERGAFTAETTRAASEVQLWLLPQIPFYILFMLATRVLSALDGNAVVFRICALNLAVNVIGNLVLMHWFGVRGIAMSTSLVYLVAAAVAFLVIRRRLTLVLRHTVSAGL